MADQEAAGFRASDDDREHVATALGAHLAAGRLKLDEFAERVDRVYRAVTLDELRALTADLGESRLPARDDEEAEDDTRRRLPFWPGNLPFITRFTTDETAKQVLQDAMGNLVPFLIANGYLLQTQQPRLLVLSKSRRPGWTIVLSVLLFPLGLLALLHREESQIIVALQSERGETTVEIAGTAPLSTRRAIERFARGD